MDLGSRKGEKVSCGEPSGQSNSLAETGQGAERPWQAAQKQEFMAMTRVATRGSLVLKLTEEVKTKEAALV